MWIAEYATLLGEHDQDIGLIFFLSVAASLTSLAVEVVTTLWKNLWRPVPHKFKTQSSREKPRPVENNVPSLTYSNFL